jgi:hypothetical protein
MIRPMAESGRSAVNRRSVLLGLCGTLFVCALTPYNDLAINNTYLVGNYVPLAVVIFFGLIVLLINAPLHRRGSRYAFSSGELSVSLGMMLVACAVPGSGLMRYLPTSLVNIWHHGAASSDLRSFLQGLDLPDWMFPKFASRDVLARSADPIVTNFRGRVPSMTRRFCHASAQCPGARGASPS